MDIKIEFNPDLALRSIEEFKAGRRKEDECIPEKLEAGKEYPFLKEGQRNYWLEGEVPLLKTEGGEKLSAPLASIKILSATHSQIGGKICTMGAYKVVEVFGDDKVHFNSYART